MSTTPGPEIVEPNNAVAAAADERLKHAYRQIASADEQLARVTRQLSKLEHDAARQPGRRPSSGGATHRGVIGVLLAACIVGAAFVLQSPSGDATKLMIARWVPGVLGSSVPLEQPRTPLGTVQVAAAGPTALPANSPAPATDVAPAVAPLSPELLQQLQTITQNIADLEQKIEQLKAVQEQAASDNAKAIGELKASQEQTQEQTTQLLARLSEPNARPRTSAAVPSAAVPSTAPSARPVAIAPRPSTSTHASSQARSQSPPAQQ